MELQHLSLEERLQRIEVSLGHGPPPTKISHKPLLVGMGLAALTCALGFKGFGLPNHPYQVAAAALTVALAYHRGWLRRPLSAVWAIVALINTAQLSFLMMLFIGGGRRYPFFWLKLPNVIQPDAAGRSWYDVVPKWSMAWEPTALTLWDIDFTVMQTFLLIVTLVGALFRFQPFVSLTALALILVSLPSFLGFNWSWVFPAIACGAVSFYAQCTIARR